MIDKLKTWAYLKVKTRRFAAAVTPIFLGLLLLLAVAGQVMAGSVEDGNPGRAGETIALENLPVKGKTTVVDLYSPYCPPCMRLAPLLEQLAQKRPDLVIKKVNIQRPEISGKIDWQSPLAKQLGLRSVPHFMIFNKKKKMEVQGKEAFQQVVGWLEEAGLLKK